MSHRPSTRPPLPALVCLALLVLGCEPADSAHGHAPRAAESAAAVTGTANRDSRATGSTRLPASTTSAATQASAMPRDHGSSSASATGSTTSSAAGAPAAPAPNAAAIGELLTKTPSTKLVPAKAFILDHQRRIGVLLGLPTGWHYDDPSYLSITPGPGSADARFAALRLAVSGLGEANLATALRRGLLPVGLAKASFAPWREGHVGTGRWPAKLARGRGEAAAGHAPRQALAAVVDVPGTHAVGLIASWPSGEPALEAVLYDIARYLRRCHVEVGRGCVADDGAE